MNEFKYPKQTAFYSGKVRDVYTINDTYLAMVASNRISAFDVILPRPIPFKGQVLTQIASYMLNQSSEICPNWLIELPAPNVSFGHKCEPFKIEMVIRGNLVGHAWRIYRSGGRMLCGQKMEDGLTENDFFRRPIITPSTKASTGHDEDISEEEIISQGLATVAEWEILKGYTYKLFEKGGILAKNQGLILADTKYEFGKLNGEICLMDELHTPDSSRYFYADGFEERQKNGERQLQLSKEFVREWLIQNNFMGKEGQIIPEMTDEWIVTISKRYIELYEKIIGKPFVGEELSDEETEQRIRNTIKKYI